MKSKILLLLLVLVVRTGFGQVYFEKESYEELDVTTYFNLKAVYQTFAVPGFLPSSPERVKMMLSQHNLFVARIDNVVVLYNFDTKQLDTLFFAYPDTKISQPFWSPDFDRVAFLIYNPRKTHGYTTEYRFIVLTLDGNKIIKKQKFNVDDVDFDAFDVTLPLYYEDLEQTTRGDTVVYDRTVILTEDTLKYRTKLGNEPFIVLPDVHGVQQVNLLYEYRVDLKTRKVEKFRYLYKKLDEAFSDLFFGRYLCMPAKIMDLRTGRSLVFPDPPYLMANWCVPIGRKLAVFVPTDREYNSVAKGYIYVVDPRDFSYKKFFVNDIIVHAFSVYDCTLKAKDSHTLEYETVRGMKQLPID